MSSSKRGMIYLAICFVLALVSGCGTNARENGPVTLEAQGQAAKAAIVISPGIVGPNEYKVTIADENNQLQKVDSAKLHFSMPGMEHGKSVEELTRNPDGTWSGEGPHIMMSGEWQLKLEWKDSSGKTKALEYEWNIEE